MGWRLLRFAVLGAIALGPTGCNRSATEGFGAPDAGTGSDTESDSDPFTCPYDCMSVASCAFLGGETHPEHTCEGEDVCCELDPDSDSSTDSETDTDTGTDLPFFDDFSGTTLFTEYAYPFGDPNYCDYPDTVSFHNLDTELQVHLGCYDEAELAITLGLPADDYSITVKWRTGADSVQYGACTHTMFDEAYGADCITPTRLIVVDDEVVHESSGQLVEHEATTVVDHSGPIETLALAFGSCGTGDGYDTWYDFVEVALQ